MARTVEKLSPTALRSKGPGLHPDGRGLYLQVKNGGRSWVLRYMLGGKARHMGLGPYPDVSLADARRDAEGLLRRASTDQIWFAGTKQRIVLSKITK